MTNKPFLWLSALMLMVLWACAPKKTTGDITTIYNQRVSAFTSGLISNNSEIRIQFSEMVPGAEPGKQASPSVIKVSPSIDGKLYWEDTQTLVLKPDKRLPSGENYKAELEMSSIFPGDESEFAFTFDIITQSFRFEKVNIQPIEITNLKDNLFIGKLVFADDAEPSDVEKVITVSQKGKNLPVSWEHQENSREHIFTASNVVREETSGNITVSWNGEPVNVDSKSSESIEIPALGDFKVMDVKTTQSPSQIITIYFSDPLDQTQDINGLIEAEGLGQFSHSINMNMISIYPSASIQGEVTLNIYPGIKNIMGFEFKNRETYQLQFETLKPAVEIIGKGTILPDSKGLILPFKTVSVKAVEVQVIKIFENNIASFLQTNNLDGDYQLRRAGRLIIKKIIPLNDDPSIDLSKWHTFSLDLANLINPDPGAIYRVVLNIRPDFSTYPCNDSTALSSKPIEDKGITDDDIAYWDTPDPYSYSNWDGAEEDYEYDWEQRDNPCHPMYYRNKSVCRNVLASNIGIVVKGGTDKELLVAVSDIRNTEPLEDVRLEVLDYQNQIVAQGVSGNDGMARLTFTHKPYLLIAKNDKQRGYLRLDEGSALSLSRFDISGQTIKKGLKGFIYGERGVWRPGDTLFLSFILEDKLKSLPQGHPVIFELINPQGKLSTRQVASLNESGLYTFRATTSSTAPSGMWMARVQVGGTTFEKTLRIETVKPNRLKIEMDFGTDIIRSGETPAAQLKSRWLHGAIARNLKARVTATLNNTQTTFKSYPDYVFDDPARTFNPEEVTVFDGSLNAEGVALVKPSLNVSEAAPGMLKANFFTRVFEESGDFSVDRFSVLYSPYKAYVGIHTPKGDRRGMLLTDTTHTIDVVTIDAKGNPLSVRNLKYSVYKVEWRWWWESGEDDLARYVGSTSHDLISSGTLSTVNGKGSFKLRVNQPEWGRFLIRVEDTQGGHAAGKTVYIDWPGWALKPTGNNPQDASMLSFTADKEKYQTGETVNLTFPSPGKGRALISIETGTRVINAFWVETKKGVTQASFEATTDMAPNVYAHITLLQPHNQADNNLPIRMYGVIPILVENPATHLTPVITMPQELQPEKTVSIKVKEAKGLPMSYTLAIVDDGLLDLTRFTTPDPWNSFYAREALGVKTWDLYDLVMGAYGGKIEKAFSLGGDDELNGKKGGTKANRFKPMVKFIGPFTLEKGASRTHSITIPRYVGSVRTMVIACNNGAYGSAQVTTPVRKPVMVQATLPRVLGPQEQVKLPVTVFAMKENIGTVKVSVNIEGPIEIDGDKSQKINFIQAGDELVTFNLKVADQTGVAKVTIEASAGKESATDVIEIQVRNPNSPITNVIEKVIQAGATADLTYTMPGIAGTNKAVLEVSSIPPVNLGARLKFLISYPHGCIEQTTSSVFPQLYLADIMELNSSTQAAIETNIRAAVNRLKGFITSDGGFAYWPGQNDADSWGTSYGGHFLLEAEKKGYVLPSGWKKDWVSYQKKMARRWNTSSEGWYSYDMLNQAYRLYTLALAGDAELSAMNRLRNEANLSMDARWRLAAAYALAGQQNVAEKLIVNAATPERNPEGFYYDFTYGSEERNLAMRLETLTLMNMPEKSMKLATQLSKQLSTNTWMSTQTTAYSCMAISKFVEKNRPSGGIKFTYSVNGKAKSSLTTQKAMIQDSVKTRELSGNLSVSNQAKGTLYARLIMEGIPAIGTETASSSNLRISIEYTNLDGKAIDVKRIPQGTDFKATVRISNPGLMGTYKNLALSQIFPSGWEIRNTRLEEGTSAHEADVPDYRDIRDDRVYSYFNLNVNQTRKYVVLLNATYKGKFYLPQVSCEAMYDHTINAREPGEWVIVE
jgi:uncharacterized protein YfaS (alpha-2-macroglobulin family)